LCDFTLVRYMYSMMKVRAVFVSEMGVFGYLDWFLELFLGAHFGAVILEQKGELLIPVVSLQF